MAFTDDAPIHLLKKGRARRSSSAGWRVVGKQRCYFRSKWEANYARYLEMIREKGHIKSWKHEPKTFWFKGIKRGVVSYLPDFCVKRTDGVSVYFEVKGYMDARSRTKIKRMEKYFPKVLLSVVEGDWFKYNNEKFAGLLQGWER